MSKLRHEIQRIISSADDIQYAVNWVDSMARKGLQAGPVLLSLGRPRRTLDQNAKMWPMLNDVAVQVEWYGERLKPEDWKDIFTASLRKQKAVPGIDGGFVVLGMRTSKMKKSEFSELIELIYAFGAEHEVSWSEKAKESYQEYKANA